MQIAFRRIMFTAACAVLVTAPTAKAATPNDCRTTYDAATRAELVRLSDVTRLTDLDDALRRVQGVTAIQLANGDRDGIFSVIYRDILRDAIASLEREPFRYTDLPWTQRVSLDFIRRYLGVVHARYTGAALSESWQRYYRRAADCQQSVGRIAMSGFTTHVIIDFPEAIWTTGARNGDARDFFFIGDVLVGTIPAIVADLRASYGYDISGFFRLYWASDLLDPLLGGRGRTSVALFQMIRGNAWVTGLAMRSPSTRAATRWFVRSEWLAIDAALDQFQARGAL